MIEPPAEQMQLIEGELLRSLNDLQNTKDLDQRHKLSEIVSNLASAQGIYLSWLASLAAINDDDWDDDFDDDDEDEDDPFDDDEDDDPLDFPSRPHG